MWGRNIYSNVRKFLQFQITCNLAVLVSIVIGTIWMTESPLSATQLIWINLIMDTLGAMALATAPPLASIIHQPAISGDVKILSKTMWRNIYGVAVWMVFTMFITVYFGRLIFDLDYTKSTATTDKCTDDDIAATEPCLKDQYAADKKTHFTVIFTTFVFLQFFNLINCRVIGANEYNIFKKPFNSWIFLLVLAAIFGI
jgi:magnesium-transporting ATPase (P-type)